MSEREKALAESIVNALETLPEHKKEFIVGYAEGINLMASIQQDKPEDAPTGD